MSRSVPSLATPQGSPVDDESRSGEASYRQIVQSLPAAMYACDIEGRITLFNEAAALLWGRRPELGTDLWCGSWRIYRPDGSELPIDRCPMALTLREGRAVRGEEIVIERPDGTRRNVLPYPEPIFDADGALTGAVNMLIDITDRKQAEDRERALARELAASNARFRVFFEQSFYYAGIMTLDGVLVEINLAALELCGYRADEVLHKPFWETSWWRGSCEVQQKIRHATYRAAAGHPFRAELPYWLADGTERITDFVLRPVWDDEGRVIYLVPTGMDVTERKRAEESLQEADRRKDDFLALLAHELRNPLAPVRHAVEVLRKKNTFDADVQWAGDVIDRQVVHLMRLIDDLLDVSRITRDRLELQNERVEIAQVIRSATEMSRPAIEDGRHALSIVLPSERLAVDGDPIRLAQVVMNLLTNAAKYTPSAGRITLSARREKDDALISVEDSGVGIPDDKLPHLFEMFYQVDRASQPAQSGLGIGLALVRRIVDLHGGSVEVHSEGAGRGSEFIVRLPLAAEGPRPVIPILSAPRTEGPGGLRILVVDDNRDAVDSLAMLLKLSGNEVRTAYDGPAGIATAESFRPDVALLDLGLPVLDGHEVCRRIREQPWGREMLLLALTGWGQDEDRRRTEAAGFDAHMVKPVDSVLLKQILSTFSPSRKS